VNYATFSKFELTDKFTLDLVEQLQLAMKRQRLPGMVEIAFYTSAESSPEEGYSLSLWLRLEDMMRARQTSLTELLSDPTLAQSESQVEKETFRLVWEQQNISQPVTASTLRLLVFPRDYSEERVKRMVDYLRELRWQTVGVRGAWIGRSLEDDRKLLVRTDWVNSEAFEQIAKSEFYQDMYKFFSYNGITTRFASSKLENIFSQEAYPTESPKSTPNSALTIQS
jgi:hypothetical protein